MIVVYVGNDRERIAAEVRKTLGEEYEVFEGAGLSVQDLMNIFQGTSLLMGTSGVRKILIKDPTPEPKKKDEKGDGAEGTGVDFYAEVARYVETPHEVVIWETRTPRKKSFTDLKNSGKIEVLKRVNNAMDFDARKTFGIFDMAYRDGVKAVKMLKEVREEDKGSDPYMFFGLMASQAIKRYQGRAGAKEKRVLRELSELDMQMKTTAVEPWDLISSFLLRISSM